MPTRGPLAPLALAACLGLLPPGAPASAGEAAQPDDSQPLTIDDASPVDRGQLVTDLSLSWDRERGGDDLFETRPRVRAGVLDGLELSLTAPYRFGEGNAADQADLEPSVQYQLTEGGHGLPVLAVEGGATLPLGSHESPETDLTFLATEPLTGKGEDGPALHLNLAWTHAFDADPGERDERYAAVVGYSHPVGDSTGLVLDLVHEQDREGGRQTSLVEAGVRREITKDLLVSLGAGTGLGGDSPEVRLVLGVQRSFKLF